MKLRTLLASSAMALVTLAPFEALAATTPVINVGGDVGAAISDIIANSPPVGTKGTIKGTAIWSASRAGFWDPLVDTLQVNATVSASITPFTPTSNTSTVAGTATTAASAGAALPAGATIVVENTGANTISLALGTSGAVAATTAGYPVSPGTKVGLSVGVNTFYSVITASSTSAFTITGGSGQPALAGGGSGTGGGGGGAVTVADGADVTLGLKADAPCATAATACTLEQRIAKMEQAAEDNSTQVPMKGTVSSGTLAALPVPDLSPFLNMSTATTTKIITGLSAKKTYISNYVFLAAGTTNAKLVTGTGTNCGTGTTDLTATYNLKDQGGMSRGSGLGVILPPVAASTDVCAVSSAAVPLAVDVAATQF